jgi:hypothetical protein
MARPFFIVPGSERSRPLLRLKNAALARFKRAGIPMPDHIPVYWTRIGNGCAYYRPRAKTKHFVTIPLDLQVFIKSGHPNGEAYFEYYVIHELCHIADTFNGTKTTSHGEPFHKIFVQVCPKRYWLFEQEYQEEFEERIADWGLEIPDNAYDAPRMRHLRFMEEGITVPRY